MNCTNCSKYNQCTKICPALEEYINQDHVKRNRNERLECERESNINDMIKKDYPESEIELSVKDWIYFVKNYQITKKQKRYLFLKYWKCLSFTDISKKYKISVQTVEQTIKRFVQKN